MKPSLTEMFFSQTMYFTIAALCLFTAYLFHKMKGNGTRKLFLWLFLSLGFNFGVDGLYWLLWDMDIVQGIQPIWVRLLRNMPFTIVTVKVAWYIGREWFE